MMSPNILREPRHVQILMFVFGALTWLRDNGYAEGGWKVMTPKGTANFDQLEASGFRVTAGEAGEALQFIRAHYDADFGGGERHLIVLLSNWDAVKRGEYGTPQDPKPESE